jgi:quercetin dioxygenase-like cupin family protein
MTVEVTDAGRIATIDAGRAMPFDWGSIQWLVSGSQIADARLTFGYVEIGAGQKNAKHLHPNCDEVLYLIEGELEHSLGDARFRLRPGMAIHIPTGVAHDAINRGASTARMVVAYSTPDRQTVTLEDGLEL